MYDDPQGPDTRSQINAGIGAMKDVATQAAEFIRRQAERRSRELGGRLSAAADDLESAGQDMSGAARDLTTTVARQLASAARRAGYYLETTDSTKMMEDARRFTREQPWTVVAIGALAGFALSRVVKHAFADGDDRA